MSLSSSTLNLKFMQRAAARNAQTSPATPSSTPNADSSISAPSRLGSASNPQPTTPSSLRPATPISADTPTIGIQAEQEAQARWHLLRPTRPSLPSRQSTETGRITFETSYLPFLGSGAEIEAGPSRVRSARAGGGRMAFGGFGEEDKEEEGEGEEGEEEDEKKIKKVKKDYGGGQSGLREADKARSTGVKREHPSTPSAPPPKPHTTSKGFHRPSNYTPDIPTSSSSSSRRDRPRAEDSLDMKPSIPASPKSKATSNNNTSGKKRALIVPDTGSEGPKRAKMDLSKSTPNEKVGVKVEDDDPVPISRDEAGAQKADLDAREREIKAAKKREKKAKRKAKIEAV